MTASATVPSSPAVARAAPGRLGLVALAAAAFAVLAVAGSRSRAGSLSC